MKVDIEHFFDEIKWELLRRVLERDIREEDVIFLIEENARSLMLEDSGELVEKKRGIYQGSGISPVLSNVYMMEFDQWVSGLDGYFVRYSDDMLVLGDSREGLLEILQEIKGRLGGLGLRVNEEKTCYASLEEGIDMLGYHFSLAGKLVPSKAIQGLQDRLATMWLTSSGLSLEEKMKKAVEIIGGWR